MVLQREKCNLVRVTKDTAREVSNAHFLIHDLCAHKEPIWVDAQGKAKSYLAWPLTLRRHKVVATPRSFLQVPNLRAQGHLEGTALLETLPIHQPACSGRKSPPIAAGLEQLLAAVVELRHDPSAPAPLLRSGKRLRHFASSIPPLHIYPPRGRFPRWTMAF